MLIVKMISRVSTDSLLSNGFIIMNKNKSYFKIGYTNQCATA